MGKLVLGAAAASVALLVACNALSGADALSTDPSSGDTEITPPETTAAGASSGGTTTTEPPARLGHEPPPATDDAAPPPPVDGGFDAASEAATTLPTFLEDFARADGPLGNAWIEKTAGKFAVKTGAAQQSATGLYRNLFASRPASENALDVFVQATITFPVDKADPCIFARIQPGSEVLDRFYAYSAYPDGAGNFYVSRDDGTQFVDMGSAIIAPPLVVGESYRISLQVTGTSPVSLQGALTKLDGTVVAAISASDGSAKRIVTTGSVGFGSSGALNGRWDDFMRVTLAP
ncbi:MAG: hypothetical protein JWP87_4158 [Labilithrix sp.]|nr:hypothetical protein [Labilithrix sp.]